MKHQYTQIFSESHISHHLHINPSKNCLSNIEQMIKNYGMGSLKPNTVVFPLQPSLINALSFEQFLSSISSLGKNLLFCKLDPHEHRLFSEGSMTPKQIHLWWRGGNQKNFELTLALACTLRRSLAWANAVICIKSVVANEEEEKKIRNVFGRYQAKLRVRNLDFETIIEKEKKFFDTLSTHSEDADFVFLGLRPMGPEETSQEYKAYFDHFMEKTEFLKNCCFVSSDEKLKFDKIFL